MSGDKPSTGRSVVLVLGMHRSGTSALSRMLSLLGCDLPKTLMPESPDNARGYWESWPVTHLNDAVLASGGSGWDDWLPFNADWYDSPVYARFVERGRGVLRDEFGDSPLFVLKDPRCARLMPYWTDVLKRESVTPLVLIPIRNPIEVAQSISRRDHIHRDVVLLMWLRHVLDAEHDTRGMARAVATYDALLNNWTELAVQMQDRLGIRWPGLSALTGMKVDDFLDPGIRHHAESPENVLMNPLLAGWLRDTFAIMLRWASDGESPDDFKALDGIRRDFDAAGPAFAGITRALSEQSAQAQELEATLAAKVAELSSLTGEVSALRASWDATREELAEREAQLHAQPEQLPQLDDAGGADRTAEIAGLESETRALRDRLTDVETLLVQREDDLARVGAERQLAIERAERASADLQAEANALRDRLTDVQDTGEAREAEIRRIAEERHLLAERVDALEAEKRGIEGRLQAADDALRGHHDALRANDHAAQRAETEARDLRDRLALVESTLRQREEEIAQAGVANAAANERLAGLEADKRKIAAKLEDADAWVLRLAEERQKAHAEIASINAELRDRDRALKAAYREIERIDAKYQACKEQAALNRAKSESDVQRLTAENVEANIPNARPAEAATETGGEVEGRIDERVGEIATLSHMLIEQSGKVATLASGLAALEQLAEDRLREIERLRAVDAVSQSNAESEARADRHLSEVALLSNMLLDQQGAAAAEAARHAAAQRLAEDRLTEIQRLSGMLGEQQAAVDALTTQHATAMDDVRASLRAKDAEVARLARDNAAFVQHLKSASNEVVALSSMLDQQQQASDTHARRAEWLRDVMVVMMRTHWWYKLLPEESVKRRKYRALKRKGLFDTDAYVARYSDVVNSGIDPLQHFIRHGMGEDRAGLPERVN
jgi:hypothetical protein